MAVSKTHLYQILAILLLSIFGCSNKAPHVGESITQTATKDGVTVTQAEDRHLLPSGKIAGENTALVQVQSTVKKIDYKTRSLTLDAQGEMVEIIAGSAVRNFNQIKAGDNVTVEYLVSVAFEVRRPTEEELSVAGGDLEIAARAKMGDMPAGGVAKARIHIATVESINKSSETIALRDLTTGESTIVRAKYPENLGYVKVGDSVVITSLEAYATSVMRVP